ncbi:uncharacterized protein V2V93DRAFT_370569 [Kockiozyma suomiensis]|uniref:uncharacterized protein n=1 Tax=Kockiozyma suomiensis TaxID=1337062 RepID=UPI003343C5B6
MEKIASFTAFLLANEIDVSPKLGFTYSPARGYHVLLSSKLKKAIRSGTVLVRIPKSAVLCGSTSVLCNLLSDEQLGTTAGLVLSYLVERAMGKRSPWFAYLSMLPTCEDSCLRFWSLSEREWITGTDAIDLLRAADTDLREMYDEVAAPFFQENEAVLRSLIGDDSSFEWKVFTSQKTFYEAASVVAARCFEVDTFIGLGLVPVADLFNHSDDEDIRFESQFEVCEACGSNTACEHDAQSMKDAAGDSDEEDDDEENDEMDHDYDSDIAPPLEDVSSKDDELSEESDDSDSEELSDTCDIVTRRHILPAPNLFKQNRELFNSYGSLNSSHLLVKYGFILRNNMHDYISLEREVRILYKELGIMWHGDHDHDLDPDEERSVTDDMEIDRVHEVNGVVHDDHEKDQDGEEWEDVESDGGDGSSQSKYGSDSGEGSDDEEEEEDEELKIDNQGRLNIHLWNRVMVACMAANGDGFESESINLEHEALSILNNSPKRLLSKQSNLTRQALGTLLILIERRQGKYPDGGLTSKEYSYMLSEEVPSIELSASDSKRRMAMTVLANEKQMLERARNRCEVALGK